MIIGEIETHSVTIEAGHLRAVIPAKTDRGTVGLNVAFKLSEHPELEALMPLIDEAVRKAANKALGLHSAAPSKLLKA